jgi:hypothetical protein
MFQKWQLVEPGTRIRYQAGTASGPAALVDLIFFTCFWKQ